jgi:thioredoxin-like negative regulator of GroEL
MTHMRPLIYLLFFASGAGGLIWFRVRLDDPSRLAAPNSFYLRHLIGILEPSYRQAARDRHHGELEEAALHLSNLIDAHPENVPTTLDLADLHLERGRPEDARPLLEEARAPEPQNPRVHAAWQRLQQAAAE